MDDSIHMDVYWMLKDANQSIRKDLHDKLAERGITWPQYHALYHIGDRGITFNELARELNCNASNMTGLIDRMMENNWVYREHSTADRRVWNIRLTPEGAALKERLIPEHHSNIRERMGALSGQELEALKQLLEKLIGRGGVDKRK